LDILAVGRIEEMLNKLTDGSRTFPIGRHLEFEVTPDGDEIVRKNGRTAKF